MCFQIKYVWEECEKWKHNSPNNLISSTEISSVGVASTTCTTVLQGMWSAQCTPQSWSLLREDSELMKTSDGFLMDQSFLPLHWLLGADGSLGWQSRGEEGNTAGNRQQNVQMGLEGSYMCDELVEIINSRRMT